MVQLQVWFVSFYFTYTICDCRFVCISEILLVRVSFFLLKHTKPMLTLVIKCKVHKITKQPKLNKKTLTKANN